MKVQAITQGAAFSGVIQAILIFFGFSALFKVSHANSALGILLLLLFLDYQNSIKLLWRTAYFHLTWAFLAYVVGWALWMLIVRDLPSAYVTDYMTNYIMFGFLPVLVVGYWVFRYPKSLLPMVLAMPVGFLARILDRWDTDNGMTVLTGAVRATFGESSASFGTWGLVMCFCGLFAMHYASAYFADRKRLKYLLSTTGIVCLFFGAACVFYAQTRALWLIAATLVPIYFLIVVFLNSSRGFLLLALGLISAATLLVGRFWDTIMSVMAARWRTSEGGLQALLTGDFFSTGYSSIDLRLRMYAEALSSWLQRPIFGWGLGSDAKLMATPSDPALAGYGFDHFHSQWLWMLVETGLIGFAFFVIALALPVVYSVRCSGRMVPVSLFVGMSIIGLSIACLTDQPLTSYRGPFVLAIIAGAMFAARLGQLDYRSARGRASYRQAVDPHLPGAYMMRLDERR